MILSVSSMWSIRKASYGDAPLLAELGKITYSQTFHHAYTPVKLARYLIENFAIKKIQEELNNDQAVFFMAAEADGTPVGYAKLVQSQTPCGLSLPDPVELERIYLLQNWHGGGIAKEFLDICITEAKLRKFKTIWLAVWKNNMRAQAFYLKEGFRHVEATKGFYDVKLQVMARGV